MINDAVKATATTAPTILWRFNSCHQKHDRPSNLIKRPSALKARAQTVSFWTLVVLAAVLIGFFLGYFYISTEQTTIGTITYHSSSIFLESLVPFSLATSWLNVHLLSTTVYIVFIPILILLKRKGWLSKTKR